MLRKEAKLGFAIGGVFVAVLIVYVVASSGTKKNGPGVQLATADNGNSLHDNSKATGEPRSSGGADDGAKSAPTTPAAAEKSNDPFAPPAGAGSPPPASDAPKSTAEERWIAALNTGKVPILAATVTPNPTPSPTTGPAVRPNFASSSGTPDQGQNTQSTPGSATDPTNVPGSVTSLVSGNGTGNGTTNFADPVPARTPPATAGMRTHVVQARETLSTIAAAAYGSQNYYPHILRANPNLDPKRLKPGMVINLPPEAEVKAGVDRAAVSNAPLDKPTSAVPANANGTIDAKTQYQVQSNDNLNRIAMRLYGNSAKWEAIYELNKETIGPDPAKLKLHMILKLPEPPTVK